MLAPPAQTVLGVPVRVRSHPLVPEISLYLADDGIDLKRFVRAIQEADHIPCWAFAWAAGAMLARLVLDEPERVRGRDVVDFGAGSGIVGIAASMAGAHKVYAVDRDPDALSACRANAALASVDLIVTDTLPEAYDVLCAADVLYASDNARLLTTFEAEGRTLLLADAYRDGVTLPADAERLVRTFPDVDAPVDRARLTVIDSEAGFRALRAFAFGVIEP
jgi:predicted nicotinamide N-methyase